VSFSFKSSATLQSELFTQSTTSGSSVIINSLSLSSDLPTIASLIVSEGLFLFSASTVSVVSDRAVSFGTVSFSDSFAFHDSICFTRSNEFLSSIPPSVTAILSHSQLLFNTFPFLNSVALLSSRLFSSTLPFPLSLPFNRTDYLSFRSDLTVRDLSSSNLFTISVSDRFTVSLEISLADKGDVQTTSKPTTPIMIGVTVGLLLLALGIVMLIIFMHWQRSEESKDVTIDNDEDPSWTDSESGFYEAEMEHEYENPLGLHQEDIEICPSDSDPDADSFSEPFEFTMLE
jgi:hypothetical protein